MADATKKTVSNRQKFDWIDALYADHSISNGAKVVGYGLAHHLNRERGTVFVSDETLSDKTGMSVRHVVDCRKELRAAGWISWTRTGTASVFKLLDGPMAAVIEHQKMLKQKRVLKRQGRVQDLHPSADLDLPPDDRDLHPSAEHDMHPSADRDLHPSVNIPVSAYPLEVPVSVAARARSVDEKESDQIIDTEIGAPKEAETINTEVGDKTPTQPSPAAGHDRPAAAKKPRRKSRRATPEETPFPDDFVLTQERIDFAAQHGFLWDQTVFTFEKWRDHRRSKGHTSADWDADFRNWFRGEINFGNRGPMKTTHQASNFL